MKISGIGEIISDDDLAVVAKNIVQLGKNMIDYGLDSKDKVIGIYLDGTPLIKALDIVFYPRNVIPHYDNIIMSSKHGTIDMERMSGLRKSPKRRFYIDRRTKTGSLGKILKEHDPDAIYCVLEDPNEKADIRATKKEIPWFNWPHEELAHLTAPAIIGYTIRKYTGPKNILNPPEFEYVGFDTHQSVEFYKQLFKAVVKEDNQLREVYDDLIVTKMIENQKDH